MSTGLPLSLSGLGLPLTRRGVTPAPGLPLTSVAAFNGVASIGLFSYTVPATHTRSSAWVETGDGRRVRTLWNNRAETPGATGTGYWDRRTDQLVAATTDLYVVKVATHNIQVTFEGGIGNTSLKADFSNYETMWRDYQFAQELVPVTDWRYGNRHYVEGRPPLFKFHKDNPQACLPVNFTATNSGCTYQHLATDGVRVYTSFYDRYLNQGQKVTGVVAVTANGASPDVPYAFSAGTVYDTTSDGSKPPRKDSVASLLTTDDMSNIITGLAVQKSGNYLVVTRAAKNTLYVLNKLTGALVQTLTNFTAPGCCCFDGQDRLVLNSSAGLKRYVFNGDGTLAAASLSFAGLAEVLSVSCNTAGAGDTLYVFDASTNQQVKAFDTTSGAQLWTLGQAGGQRQGPAVAVDKFYGSDVTGTVRWFTVCPLADGSFWTVEPGNNRMQLFTAARVPVTGALGLISYRTNGYVVAKDKNNERRLFWELQEFDVDYTKDITTCWTLKYNWQASMPAEYFDTSNPYQNLGIAEVFNSLVTDPVSGYTYASCQRMDGQYTLLELDPVNGIRVVPAATTGLGTTPFSLRRDLSASYSNFTPSGGYEWKDRAVASRSGHDPTWAAAVQLINLPTIATTDPVDFTGAPNADASQRTDSGYRVLYQKDLIQIIGGVTYGLGWHLGLVKEGNTRWDKLLNHAVPSIYYAGGQPLDGYYDIGDHELETFSNGDIKPKGYGGAGVKALGEFIFEKVYGEFYRDGQQNQSFIWHSSGAMLASFGYNSDDATQYRYATGNNYLPGMSGGVHRALYNYDPNDNNVAYEWHGEEGGSGTLNRWRIVGLNTLLTQSVASWRVGISTTVAPAYPTGSKDLLANSPKAGTIYTTANCGWTQNLADSYQNPFSGGPYWVASFGLKSWDLFKSPGFFFRFRGTNTGPVTVTSDPFTTGSTGLNWSLLTRLNFEGSNDNENELGDSNSGGLYAELLDVSGKVLVRFYPKAVANGQVAVYANAQVLTQQDASPNTTLRKQLTSYQDWRVVSTAGVVTVSWAGYSATLTTPLESGADFTQPARLRFRAWDNGKSRDRFVALLQAEFVTAAGGGASGPQLRIDTLGLLVQDTLADASKWNLAGSNWSYVPKKAYVAGERSPRILLAPGGTAPTGQPAYSYLTGIPSTVDAGGVREGCMVVASNGRLYLFYGAGNGISGDAGLPWRPQLAVSRDDGLSWTKYGDMGLGLKKFTAPGNVASGTWAANDQLFVEEIRPGVFHMHRMTAATQSDGVPGGPYFSEILELQGFPDETTNWQWVQQEVMANDPNSPTNGYDENSSYGGSIMRKNGFEYLFFTATTLQNEFQVGLAIRTGGSGPFTKQTTPLLPIAIKGNPENPKVFESIAFPGYYVLFCNQVNKTLGPTDRNTVFLSTNLLDWSAATRSDVQRISAADSAFVVGLPQPRLGLGGEVVQSPEGYVPFDYDADPLSNTTPGADHKDRKIRTVFLEPSYGVLAYNEPPLTVFTDSFDRPDSSTVGNGWINAVGTVVISNQQVDLGSSPGETIILHNDNIADGKVSASFTIGDKCSNGVLVRTDAAVSKGYLFDVGSDGNGVGIVFYKIVGTGGYQNLETNANKITHIDNIWPAGSTHTVDVEFTGSAFNVYIDGRVRATYTDSTYLAAGYTGLRNGSGGTGARLVNDYMVSLPTATATVAVPMPRTPAVAHQDVLLTAFLEADALPQSGGILGVSLRQQTAAGGDRYHVGVDDSGKLALRKVVGGVVTTTIAGTGTQTLYVGYMANRLRVQVVGATITAWLNGEQQLSYTDTNAPLSSGVNLGTIAKNVSGRVRNVDLLLGDTFTVTQCTPGQQLSVYLPGNALVATKVATGSTVTFGAADGIVHWPLGKLVVDGNRVSTDLLWGGTSAALVTSGGGGGAGSNYGGANYAMFSYPSNL